MIRTRQQLSDQATNVNIIDNNTKEIEAVEVRNQYTDERDSTINILDDGISPKTISGTKLLTYALPPILANLTDDDVPTKKNVEDLIASLGLETSYVPVNTLAELKTAVEVAGDVNILVQEDIANDNISFDNITGIKNIVGHSLSFLNFTSTGGGTVNFFNKVTITGSSTIGATCNINYRNLFGTFSLINSGNVQYEYLGGTISSVTGNQPTQSYWDNTNKATGFENVSFKVSSDAPVSDDVLFFGLIEINTSSQVLHPKLTSVSYEVSLDAVTYVAQADLTALQSWITTNGSGNDYVIRVISVYGASQFGEASSIFKFKQI